MTRLWVVVVTGFVVTAAARAGDTPPQEKKPPQPEKPVRQFTAMELASYLRKPMSLPDGLGANTPLRDALEFVASRLELPILINHEAFRAAGVQDVEAQPVRLPRMTNVRLGTVLRLVLGQVNGQVHVRSDYLEVRPQSAIVSADPSVPLEAPQLIYAEFAKVSLELALESLSEDTETTILLDAGRAGEKAKTAVTAKLKNVPLGTAVQLLADLAELKAVKLDNAWYVTTADNAARLIGKKGTGAAAFQTTSAGQQPGM
jgi:hypothetical protein